MTTIVEMREKLARLIEPDWFGPCPSAVNNYPGQHLMYQERALKKADAIIAAFPQLSAVPSEDVLQAACDLLNKPWDTDTLIQRIAAFATAHAAKEREACEGVIVQIRAIATPPDRGRAGSKLDEIHDLANEAIRARQSP